MAAFNSISDLAPIYTYGSKVYDFLKKYTSLLGEDKTEERVKNTPYPDHRIETFFIIRCFWISEEAIILLM